MKFDIVVAVDKQRGIGKNGTLPWRLPGDLAHFKKLTSTTSRPETKNAVLMGRKTWESIPEKMRPLKNRVNVVISRRNDLRLPAGVQQANCLEDALVLCGNLDGIETCFVIGGAQIYELAMGQPSLSKLYVTEIDAVYDCDTFFPDYRTGFNELAVSEVQSEAEIHYRFKALAKVTPP